MSSAEQATPAALKAPANTVKVEKGELSSMVSLDGTLTYRARSDGSPYSVINQARGTYTELPEVGDKVDCGDLFYRVDDNPVLLLCGTVPAYRDLDTGDRGKDVRQLNRNLRRLDDGDFTWERYEERYNADLANGLVVGAIVAVNAVGDIIDPTTAE